MGRVLEDESPFVIMTISLALRCTVD